MVQLTRRVEETRGDVIRLEVRVFRHDVVRRLSGGQKIEDVDHADAQATNTGSSATLFRLNGNAGQKLGFAHWTPHECTWRPRWKDTRGCKRPIERAESSHSSARPEVTELITDSGS